VSTSQQENIRVALIGCGRISVHHIAALKTLPNVEIVAVCDTDERRARQTATRHAIPRCYGDADAMLRETKPTVVHLLTPPATHLPLARIAFRYRAHVYIEKPFAASEADAREICDLARNARVQVCPGHSRLLDPVFLEASRRVSAGHIGQVISVRAEQGFTYEPGARSAVIPWSYSYDWGTFDNLMCHPLYLACHFLSLPGKPQVVGFNLGTVREAAVEEIRVLIPSENGIGEVSLSLCSAPEVNRLEIVGTKGRVTADWRTMAVLTSPNSRLPSVLAPFAASFKAAAHLMRSALSRLVGLASGKVSAHAGLRSTIEQFYGSITGKLRAPVAPEAGVLNARLMDQIREACEGVRKQRPALNVRQENPPKILVTGASGFLGGRLVEVLSSQGRAVRGATRLVSRARAIPGVEWVQCDLSAEDELRAALRNIETVFHCAALCGAPGSLEDFEDANVRGTLRLVRIAADAGVKTFVHVSSMTVYAAPDASGTILDESSPYDGRAAERGAYTRSKLAADAALLEYARRELSPRIIVLRPATMYGPGARLPVGRFQLPSSRERPVVSGSRRVSAGLVYVDNVVDAMLAAERSGVPTGSIYNLVDSADCDQEELARTIFELSQGRIRPVFAPYPLVWVAMLALDLLHFVRTAQLGTRRYRLQRTLAPMRFECAAARKDLGWLPRVSLAQGLARVLEGDPRQTAGA
jgi:nucleoside-diphosphate-sugar epimerase/predicted dehydrogenase